LAALAVLVWLWSWRAWLVTGVVLVLVFVLAVKVLELADLRAVGVGGPGVAPEPPPTIFQREATPTKPGRELATLAEELVTQREAGRYGRRVYAASALLFADAFAAEPRLAPQHRYNAACSAALAVTGQGEDAQLLPDKVVSMFRGWALSWLRDSLTAYGKLAEKNNPASNQEIQQGLVHWKGDSDLVSVRDAQALERLPENERIAWQALWRDVDELLKRVAKKDEPTKGLKKPETPKAQP
jgi:hypothetical protein